MGELPAYGSHREIEMFRQIGRGQAGEAVEFEQAAGPRIEILKALKRAVEVEKLFRGVDGDRSKVFIKNFYSRFGGFYV